MEDKTEISQEEALQRIKAEIVAFDWLLNQRRIDLLADAFAALKNALPGRRGYDYVMAMAVEALAYQERHGNEALPEALDFFKQSLAHLVTMIEEDELSQAREAELFHLVHGRFEVLKKKIATAKFTLAP